MTRTWWKALAALGGTLFAGSFFLPPGAPHSPWATLRWTAEAASSSRIVGESAAFAAVTLVVAYPYVWAALAALAGQPWAVFRHLQQPWLHLAVQAVGGLTLAALGGLLLAVQDTWLPGWLPWVAVLVPFALLAAMTRAVLRAAPERRLWSVTALGFLPHAPLDFLLAGRVRSLGEPAWGFYLGGIGALLGLIGSLRLVWLRAGPSAADPPRPPTPATPSA